MTDAGPADPDLETRRRRVGIVVALVVVAVVIGGGMWLAAHAIEQAVEERRRQRAQAVAERVRQIEQAVAEKKRRLDVTIESARTQAAASLTASPLEIVVVLTSTEGGARARIGAEEFGLVSDSAAMEKLRRRVEEFRLGVPEESRPQVSGRVDAESGVSSSDVVRTVDALIVAGLTDIAFVGTPALDPTLDAILQRGGSGR